MGAVFEAFLLATRRSLRCELLSQREEPAQCLKKLEANGGDCASDPKISKLSHFHLFDIHLAEVDFAETELVGVGDHRDLTA